MRGLPTSPFTAAGLLSSSSSSSSMSTPPLLAIASCSFASSTSFDVPKYLQRLNVGRQEKHNYKIDFWPTCKSHSLLPSPWRQGSQSDQRFDRHRLPPRTSPTNNTWSINRKWSGVFQNKCQLSSCTTWCFLFTCMYFLNWFLSWFLFSVDLQVVLQCQKLQAVPRPWEQQKQQQDRPVQIGGHRLVHSDPQVLVGRLQNLFLWKIKPQKKGSAHSPTFQKLSQIIVHIRHSSRQQ